MTHAGNAGSGTSNRRDRRVARSGLFRSFWMAGFECSSHLNSAGARLDMTAALQHDLYAAADYRRIREAGMTTARDALRWHRIDRCGALDWCSWLPMVDAALSERVQVIWDLFHYGWPDDLDFFSAAFVDRFARFAGEAARIHREHTGETPWFSPVNEISFFSWAASRDLMFPYAHGCDVEIKRQLVRANIAAIEAIRDVTPGARLVSPEPLIHTVAPQDSPWCTEAADRQNESQFEAWDMLAGRAAPELGGAAHYLDILGLNFYAANQWEVSGGRKLQWDAGSNDPRWLPLHKLIAHVYRRYQRPVFLAETSHYGIGRAPWIDEIASECVETLRQGVPLEGVCLYPILDRFDWDDRNHWHNSGLWDMFPDSKGHYGRVLNSPYAAALKRSQILLTEGMQSTWEAFEIGTTVATSKRVARRNSPDADTTQSQEECMQSNCPIITFSHLRWDFVYQRPQHLLSRLASHHRVIFIEEPVQGSSERPEWEFFNPAPGILVCRPHTPSSAPGYSAQQLPYIKQLLHELIELQNLDTYLVWFYTPMALPLAEGLKPQAVIYDCMDELSAFLNAPPELLERETRLLKIADLVLTGGASLYHAKKGRNPNVHCFPSSVEAKHFACAANGMDEAPDQTALPHPRLGYFGVIDERLDVPLLKAIADAHPEWSICMVGPVVKIDPATLPRNANIRYFGQRSYQALPSYLKGWDVCLLPFARNRSTAFISPTKTLEYMAAGKMIVSTPITDVAAQYGDIVYLGGTPTEFIAACERAPNAGQVERTERQKGMHEVLGRACPIFL